MRKAKRTFFWRLTLLPLIIVLGIVFVFPKISYADIYDTGVAPDETLQTNPKIRTSTVTASVRDRIAPSIPILISPENNSLLNASPPFVWRMSEDSYGIAKYQLYINGSIYQDDIKSSLSGYSETGGVITFTPATPLADGTYTWKIRATDNNGNVADSATWTFTIDSTPPLILITQIGDEDVSISSQDSSTIPVAPIELSENSPTIIGTTEANLIITVTIHYPNGTTTNIEVTADSSGKFTVTLPILPVNTIITLDFLTHDAAGNYSVISGVKIKIVKVQEVIPIPPPFDEIIPPIPVPQPEEVQEEIQRIIQHSLISTLPFKDAQKILGLFPYLAFLIGLLIPLLAFLSALFMTGMRIQQFTLSLFFSILRALALLPPPRERGIVFDSTTLKPIQYAYIEVLRTKDSKVIGTSVTNKYGIYASPSIDPGEYFVRVYHRDYTFPTQNAPGRFQSIEEYYKGESFIIHEFQSMPILFIPMDAIKQETKRRLPLVFAHMPTPIVLPMTILVCILAFAYPSLWNICMAFLYLCTLTKRTYVRHHKAVSGSVKNTEGTYLTGVILSFQAENDQQDVTLTQTDENGRFFASVPSQKHVLTLSHSNKQSKSILVNLETTQNLEIVI